MGTPKVNTFTQAAIIATLATAIATGLCFAESRSIVIGIVALVLIVRFAPSLMKETQK
ncbi:MAG TPA: hypothetical protein VKY85_07550 [Candidatus Angelobacter sp.]|nr:hypothetical protein [Candidatus Angelobacter sp.]